MRLAEHAPSARPAARRRGELGPDVAARCCAAPRPSTRSSPPCSTRCAPVRTCSSIEDLHWADEATLDLVRFLARRIATLPLLLVLSYRDALGVDHPLSPVLGDLVSSPRTRSACS